MYLTLTRISTNLSEQEEHSDPELLSSWFMADEHKTPELNAQSVSNQHGMAPIIVQGGQFSEEHSDTYEQLICVAQALQWKLSKRFQIPMHLGHTSILLTVHPLITHLKK